MGKGSSPAGNTTTTVNNVNPVQQAQQPFLNTLWNYATGYGISPLLNFGGGPNGPVDPFYNYAMTQGNANAPGAGNLMGTAIPQLSNLIGLGIPGTGAANQLTANAAQGVGAGNQYAGNISGTANNITGQAPYWSNLLQGTGANAISGLSGLSGNALTAANPAEAGLYGTSGMAISGNPIYNSLMGMAGGQYINPSTNPALAGTLQAATQPLVNQYQLATAPQTASSFEGAGRYGSGAMDAAQSNNQYNLGQALGTTTSNIVNNAYNTGLQATLGAGQALGSAYNQGIANQGNLLSQAGQLAQSGVTGAGNILNAAYNTGGNLLSNAAGTGLNYLNAGLSGLGTAGNLLNQFLGTANTGLTGAGNIMNYGDIAATSALQTAPTFAQYPEQQYTAAENIPFLPISNAASIVGPSVGGTGTQTTMQPYFQNSTANALGTIGGLTGIANTIGGSSGIFPGAIAGGLSKI